MKKTLLTLAVIIAGYSTYAQNTFPSSGYVGIGTTPSELLTLRDPNIAYDAASGIFKVRFDSGGGGGAIGFEKESFNTGGLRFFTQYGYGSSWEKMRITGDGNVGIGTTSPGYKLDVNGTGNFDSSLSSSSLNVNGTSIASGASQINLSAFDNNGIHINGNLPNTAQDAITYSSGGGGGAAIGFGRGGSYDTFMAFYTNSGSNVGAGRISEAMRITQSQNIGIGTTSPDAKLTVNGTIHSTEVKVDLSVPGPDYVFNSDYKLPNLAEIKSYVDKNHHLPEIPSANQMAKDGLNLGDMNTRLLKKVEELTLYLIDKDRQLSVQQTAIQSQQDQINELRSQVAKLIEK